MPRLTITVSEALRKRLTEQAHDTGRTVSATAAHLLAQALDAVPPQDATWGRYAPRTFKCQNCGHEWRDTLPTLECPQCGHEEFWVFD